LEQEVAQSGGATGDLRRVKKGEKVISYAHPVALVNNSIVAETIYSKTWLPSILQWISTHCTTFAAAVPPDSLE